MAINFQEILNPAQYQAVAHENGPLLIVAGAGTGKTRTLVHRVAYLIERGFSPQSILLLTFTRKAAQEMLTRSSQLVGHFAGRVSGGTFHSLAHGLLRTWAPVIGYSPSFTVMAQDDSEALVGLIRASLAEVQNHNRFPKKEALLNVISQAVNRQITVKEVIERHFNHFKSFIPEIEHIAALYAREKSVRSLMDFDDLLVNLVRLLSESENVRQKIAGTYAHVLVDEYQDTNPLQAKLTWLLGRDHQNVTVVGDEAQSIYSFRGASFRNIMDFPSLFPKTAVITLEDNYRSKSPILTVANKVIGMAKNRFDKNLRSIRGTGPRPTLYSVTDLSAEAQTVCAAIQKRLKKGLKPEDMAVLFRNSSHSFELELLLQRNKISFTKYGGRKFLESAHIKGFLSILRTAVNPSDTVSFSKVLQNIKGIGPQTAEAIMNFVGGHRDKLARLTEAPISGRLAGKLGELSALLEELIRPDEICPVLKKVKLTSEYYCQILPDIFPDDYPSRQSDLLELTPMLDRPNLEEALSELTLDPPSSFGLGRTENGRPLDLTLSTIHSAKGLEWPVVFVLSAVEGRFPVSFVTDEENVEEERRLFYVALTRAKDELHILMPNKGISFSGPMTFEPSRFLNPLQSGDVDVIKHGRPASFSEIAGLGYDSYDEDDSQEQDFSEESDSLDYFSSPALTTNNSGRKAKGKTASLGHKNPAHKVKPLPPPEPPSVDLNYVPKVSHRVSHPIYGPGLVIKIIRDIVVVDFEHYSQKRLKLPYARLSRLKDRK
ncbi:MAG: ATP-dependent helicase [Deltaproteobacteria bacterium]|jgi:DNA helicase-2/ATP-dependent DNA helicase PcrA|nr:ATP-dependent helicase [Deltaproteobacteria bacterium]